MLHQVFFKTLAALAVTALLGFASHANATPPETPTLSGWHQFDSASGKAKHSEWRRQGVRNGTGKGSVSVTWFYQRRAPEAVDAYFEQTIPQMLKRYAGGGYTILEDVTTTTTDGISIRRIKVKIKGHKRTVFLVWVHNGDVFKSAFIRANGVPDAPKAALEQVVALLG